MLRANVLSAPGTLEVTMCLVWLMEECISTASSRLPPTLPMRYAIATDSATTCSM